MPYKPLNCAILSVATLLFQSDPLNAAVFGADDRRPVHSGTLHHFLASATAMMVSPNMIQKNEKGFIDLDFPMMTESYGVCATEPNANQPSNPIACTGFLISPDLLVTAGHCMINVGETRNERNAFCESFSWLFDYQVRPDGTTQLKNIDPSRLVGCKEVVYAGFNYDYTPDPETFVFKRDYAIVRLERPMIGRAVLKVAAREERLDEPVFTLGHPSGTPLTVSTGARVLKREVGKEFFVTNLDVVGGNSGGPVFNGANEIIGLIVRSFPDQDYVLASGKSCYVPNSCDEKLESCLEPDSFPRGTEVQRVPVEL